MIIKKYVAKDMNDAMGQIKLDLGPEAVIIAKRKIRKPGVLGVFSSKILEVTAAKENKITNYGLENDYDTISSLKSMMNKEISNRAKDTAPSIERDNQQELKNNKELENDKSLKNELKEVKGLLYKFIEDKENGELDNYSYKDLDLVQELEKDLGKNLNLEEIKEKIEKVIEISSEKFNGKTVLVGPTGVGKTTTIAKLAGRLSLIEKKKVGLITIDTYRIGAVEQLKTYAEIMNLPFRVVMTLNEMDEALNAMKNCEVILIDSTGRSSKNLMQISELRAFMDKIKPDNISLVLSSTTKNNDLRSIIDGYSILGYKDLIITKLDETTSYGTILNASYLSKSPIRYLTNGQNVPDDIKIVSKDEIINLIIGEGKLC